MKKKKRKIFKIIAGFIILLVIAGVCLCFYLVSPVSSDSVIVNFKIEKNTSVKDIVKNLKDSNLIRNEQFTILYYKLNNFGSLNAGSYELNQNMSLREIFNTLSDMDSLNNDSIRMTFHEGKNIRNYAKIIAKNTDYTEEDVINKVNDKEYLKKLISKYWFLTDKILDDNIYYPLEGYLAPDTYQFNKDATLEDIFNKLLDEENTKLEKYKSKLNENNIHNYLTLASIAELEGNNSDNRKNIVGVFVNRINNNIPLGSDVTTYYANKIDMGDRDLTYEEIIDENPYNTRPLSSAGKLPIGPICNPSIESIDAVINYTPNNYFYFVADKNGEIYFTETEDQHTAIIDELKEKGLWFTYEE